MSKPQEENYIMDSDRNRESAGALENITVLDLSRVLAGPYCGAMLGDFGARVIKIEQPGKGDDGRFYGPHENGESLYFGNLNRNKYGVTINLKDERGKELFKKLVLRADVVVENFRPGTMDKLGLGYPVLKAINPRLIYGAITGFGSYGPYADRPGYDIIAQAMGGLMSITGQEGDPPTRAGNAIGDILGGMNMTIGILAALIARNQNGRGQYIDVSLVDSVVASLEQAWQRFFISGALPTRHGNSYDAIAPYDSFKASDGWLVIGCGNQKLFEIFCRNILEKPELIQDERFTTVPLRVENNKAFKKIVETWLAGKTVEKASNLILAEGIPAGPILDLKQIAGNEHIANAREMFVTVDHPVAGKVKLNGNPVKFSETKAKIRQAFPALGQHNGEIFSALGYSDEEIARLHAEGVI
jgi:formyl-CoA transferase